MLRICLKSAVHRKQLFLSTYVFFVAISNCLPLHIPIQAFDVARGHLSSVDVARGRQSPQGPFSQRPGGGRGGGGG